MDIYKNIKLKRDEILKIAAKHGATNVRIIGSVARKEAKDHSDLDFIVKLEAGRTLLDHSALILELQELLGRKVDIASEKGLKKHVRDRIIKEAVPL